MTTKYLAIVAVLLGSVTTYGQQAATPQLLQIQPCAPIPTPPKGVHPGVPAWLQKQINKQKSRLQKTTGTTVDAKEVVKDSDLLPPCPAVKQPKPKQ